MASQKVLIKMHRLSSRVYIFSNFKLEYHVTESKDFGFYTIHQKDLYYFTYQPIGSDVFRFYFWKIYIFFKYHIFTIFISAISLYWPIFPLIPSVSFLAHYVLRSVICRYIIYRFMFMIFAYIHEWWIIKGNP